MDFTSIVLIQIAIFSCAATLLPSSRSNSSIKIAAIVVLTILAMSWSFVPEQAAKISIFAWLVLFLMPILLMQRLESFVTNSNYVAASQLAKWLRWLLPTDGMWNYHHLLRGIALAHTGQIEAAQEIFDKYQTDDRTELGRSSTALLYRSTDRWHEYIIWVKERLTSVRRLTIAKISREFQETKLGRGMNLVYYLRAIAETGDLRGCIAEVNKLEQSQQISLRYLHLLRMYILAYCGRVDAVTQSCQRILSNYSAEIQQFWISTAELAADNVDARKQLVQMQALTADSCLNQDILWRLSKPLPDLALLTPADWEIVSQMESAIAEEVKYGSQTPTNIPTPATNLLIWLNVLIFAAELGWQYKTGAPAETFINWGGLAAPLVVSGQWWRIVSANFLHMGILHLGMNMLALLYLGKFVEYRLGTVRFIVTYLLAGLGSMATITYIDTKWMTDPHITVGASGAIMGLLGAMGAIHLTGWQRAKATSAGRQFQAVLFSVGFQLVFDLTNGHTSIVGHFSGLVIGFVVGLVLALFGTRE
jgi:rhomboid protease GluP